jgi:hypothetical protein
MCEEARALREDCRVPDGPDELASICLVDLANEFYGWRETFDSLRTLMEADSEKIEIKPAGIYNLNERMVVFWISSLREEWTQDQALGRTEWITLAQQTDTKWEKKFFSKRGRITLPLIVQESSRGDQLAVAWLMASMERTKSGQLKWCQPELRFRFSSAQEETQLSTGGASNPEVVDEGDTVLIEWTESESKERRSMRFTWPETSEGSDPV